MKHLHKFASVLLALVMALSLMVPAFATETEDVGTPPATTDTNSQDPISPASPYQITIKNAVKGHTYTAYQIFTGDLAKNGTNEQLVLSNIKWGAAFGADDAGPDDTTSISAVFGGNAPTGETAADFANALNNQQFGSDLALAFAQVVGAMELTASSSKTAEEDGDVVIDLKSAGAGYYLVKDTSTSNANNDAISLFMLEVVGSAEATPKADVPKVDKEVADVNDSEENGKETWDDKADHDIGDDIKFRLTATLPSNYGSYDKYKLVFHDTLSAGLDYNNGSMTIKLFTSDEAEGTEITGITPNYDVDASGKKLTVTIKDLKEITDKAAAGSKIVVEYTAKLNKDAQFVNENTVYLEYSNNPNNSGNGDNESTGTTPPETVVVFTYNVIVNKVDGEKQPLSGAEFTLYKYDADAQGEDKWVASQTFVMSGEKNDKFTAKGLDDGWYKLVETKTPDGYNTAADIYFKVTATENFDVSDPANSTVTLEVKATDDKGTILDGENKQSFEITGEKKDTASTDVVNQRGVTLPETGGIGTTIFYVVGGLLTVGAVVLLVTKKRMSVDSDK